MHTDLEHSETYVSCPLAIDAATQLNADLIIPPKPTGAVLLAHGVGSSRLSPRNRYVATILRNRGLATLLLDLSSTEEQALPDRTPIEVGEMARRIVRATSWLHEDAPTAGLPIGYFGAGTGAAAALLAGAQDDRRVRGIVVRGARVELARACLPRVRAPALLIVGARDLAVVHDNRDALDKLGSTVKRLEVIPGARHLFEEPGTLAAVAMHAASWLAEHLVQPLPAQAVVCAEQ